MSSDPIIDIPRQLSIQGAMWSRSHATAQSGVVTSASLTLRPWMGKPSVVSRFAWHRPRRYSDSIFAGRFVPSLFQCSRSKAGGASPIM